MGSSLLNVSSTIIFFALCNLSLSHKSNAIDQQTVNDICAKNVVPKTCLSILNDDPRTQDTNLQELVSNVINRGFSESYTSQRFVPVALGINPSLKSKGDICLENYKEFDQVMGFVLIRHHNYDNRGTALVANSAGNALISCKNELKNDYSVLMDFLDSKNEILDVLVDMTVAMCSKLV